MRYFGLMQSEGDQSLAVEAEVGSLVDLTAVDGNVAGIEDLVRAASLSGLSIDGIARRLLDTGPSETLDLARLIEDSRDGDGDTWLDRPLDPPEVWAAGVTYRTSEMERRRESGTPDVYSKVFSAARPELFLKATAERCVGPFESIGIRADSDWNVPEPELAFVLYAGQIVGYTAGNDVSSRSIEGENPLYLPQAKVFDRCCAIGPCFVTPETLGDPHDLTISCSIRRDGAEVFAGQASTSEMARKCEELADWLQRHNTVPAMTTVLTGTSIVPPEGFTLKEGDVVAIEIEGVGTLENDVVVV